MSKEFSEPKRFFMLDVSDTLVSDGGRPKIKFKDELDVLVDMYGPEAILRMMEEVKPKHDFGNGVIIYGV